MVYHIAIFQTIAHNLSYVKNIQYFFTKQICWCFHRQRPIIQIYIILLFSIENVLL
jgi:hypothetical protein